MHDTDPIFPTIRFQLPRSFCHRSSIIPQIIRSTLWRYYLMSKSKKILSQLSHELFVFHRIYTIFLIHNISLFSNTTSLLYILFCLLSTVFFQNNNLYLSFIRVSPHYNNPSVTPVLNAGTCLPPSAYTVADMIHLLFHPSTPLLRSLRYTAPGLSESFNP